MNSPKAMNLAKIAMIVVLCGLAAACGRKGALEAPQSSVPPPKETETSPQSPDSKPTVDVKPQPNAP